MKTQKVYILFNKLPVFHGSSKECSNYARTHSGFFLEDRIVFNLN